MSYRNKSRYDNRGGRSGGGFGRSFTDQGPKPVEIGKEYDVEVTELSRRGDGVAKVQGFIIFVKGAKVGEKVKIKVETVGPRFATANIVGSSNTKSDDGNSSSSSSSSTSVVESV
jgi:predicted RNA-binding protein with TRAM domain